MIINHPRGGTNYFPYVGYDPATGLATRVSDWDTKFTLVEVFNDSSWHREPHRHRRRLARPAARGPQGVRGRLVGLARHRRPRRSAIRARASRSAPTIRAQLTANLVRDAARRRPRARVAAASTSTAKLGTAGPGDTDDRRRLAADGRRHVQAATWIDVDVARGRRRRPDRRHDPDHAGRRRSAEPGRSAGTAQMPVTVRATGGFVVIAAYGDASRSSRCTRAACRSASPSRSSSPPSSARCAAAV